MFKYPEKPQIINPTNEYLHTAKIQNQKVVGEKFGIHILELAYYRPKDWLLHVKMAEIHREKSPQMKKYKWLLRKRD